MSAKFVDWEYAVLWKIQFFKDLEDMMSDKNHLDEFGFFIDGCIDDEEIKRTLAWISDESGMGPSRDIDGNQLDNEPCIKILYADGL